MAERRPAKRLFTIEDANRALPLVRVIARDYDQLHREISSRSDWLREIADRRDQEPSDVYSDEVAVAVRKLKSDNERLDELAEELRQLGITVNEQNSAVEFPAEVLGRKVLLSWRLGESEVMFWRDPDVEGSEREPIGNLVSASEPCGGTLEL